MYRDGGTERPPRRWAPRDPLHEQCIAPGCALTVAPTGLTFHHPDGEDIAVRVLPASTQGLSFLVEGRRGWHGPRALEPERHNLFVSLGVG